MLTDCYGNARQRVRVGKLQQFPALVDGYAVILLDQFPTCSILFLSQFFLFLFFLLFFSFLFFSVTNTFVARFWLIFAAVLMKGMMYMNLLHSRRTLSYLDFFFFVPRFVVSGVLSTGDVRVPPRVGEEVLRHEVHVPSLQGR